MEKEMMKQDGDLASEQAQGGEVQATEQEQQQLAQYFEVSSSIIHGEGDTGDAIAKLVLNDKDITSGVGNAATAVLIATEKQVGKIPDDMKMQLALEIIAELSELAVQAGALSEEEINDSYIDGVVSHAYSSYLSTKEAMGELDPQELEQNVGEAESILGKSVRNGPSSQDQQKPNGLMSMARG